MYYNLSDNRVCVDISKSTVLSRLWEPFKFINAILNVSKNGFRYVETNQKSIYYPYMDICIMNNGIHHVSVASLKKQGYTKAIIVNIEESFPHVYSDGEYWYNKHTKQVLDKLYDFRLGLLFELYKLKYHITYYDIPNPSSVDTTEFVITDTKEIEENPDNIIYLREDLITYELCVTVFTKMKNCGWFINEIYLQIIPQHLHDINLITLAIEVNADNFKFAKKLVLDYNVCKLAVEKNADNIIDVPTHLLDYELCFTCVSKKSDNIKFIPENFITDELCIMACQHNILNIFAIPKHFINKELICSAMKIVEQSIDLKNVWFYISTHRADLLSEENLLLISKEINMDINKIRKYINKPIPNVLDDIIYLKNL